MIEPDSDERNDEKDKVKKKKSRKAKKIQKPDMDLIENLKSSIDNKNELNQTKDTKIKK